MTNQLSAFFKDRNIDFVLHAEIKVLNENYQIVLPFSCAIKCNSFLNNAETMFKCAIKQLTTIYIPKHKPAFSLSGENKIHMAARAVKKAVFCLLTY